ncbi:MAG: hypothetical protein BWY76_02475 [bacterium ADurb.Bin429]|nr:MAG: hypothetical protein BWY76_02475 [bacterium ADurb.Bin429]
MGTRSGSRTVSLAVVVLVCGLLGALAACASNTAAPPIPPPLRLPQVTFDAAPDTLCQAATQIRLTPELLDVWPITMQAQWTLSREGESAVLSQGEWQPGMGELFVAFPKGESLPPGRYTLALRADGIVLGAHTFTIAEDAAAVTSLGLALTPSGPILTRLPGNTQHFYLRYTYQGACPGAPYWIAVRYGEALVCSHNATLLQAEGAESVPCYHKDSAPLAEGDYHVELTLMGRTQHTFAFEVGDAPALTPTATPTAAPTVTATPLPTATPAPALVCAPPFAAAGLTPDGEPFLPQNRFEWYSQVIYVGTKCEGLLPGAAWESAWYRNGANVRTASGVWNETDGAGVIWDSITGIPGAPFLLPGEYTVTLTLDDTAPLTATFRLIAYVRPEPESTTEP